MPKKIMFGVSTEQNTTNLIPALQENIELFVMIETSKANTDNWSKGIRSVFKKHKIKFDSIVLEKEEDSRIDYIIHYLYEYIAKNVKEEDIVIWNLGGGQKPHQLAIWTVFTNEQKLNYQSCYTNPITKQTEWWIFNIEGQLIFESKPTVCKASLFDIITTFGFEIKEQPELIYKKGENVETKQVKDFYHVSELRKYLYLLPLTNPDAPSDELLSKSAFLGKIYNKRNNITEKFKNNTKTFQHLRNIKNFDSALAGLVNVLLSEIRKELTSEIIFEPIPITNEELKKLFSKNSKSIELNFDLIEILAAGKIVPKSSFYFEQILIQRMKQLLENTPQDIFVEAYANLKTYIGDEMKAEYDIILLTKWGTLIAVDAKTFDVKQKDFDARIHNLEKAGGRYVKFILAFPYHPDDMIQIKEIPDVLKKLPISLSNKKMPFFVIADGESDTFYIDKITLQKTDKQPNSIEINTLNNFFNFKF